jgi:exodeoxyribonuclease-3
VRVLNWNISHGGGSRISAICNHIEHVRPDLLALTEFQARNESSLRTHLQRLGYPFIATSNPVANQNGLLVASKWQLDHAADQDQPDMDRERWLALRLNELDLDLLVLHIPGAPDNKFQDGYGVSGARRKEVFWQRTISYADRHRDRRAIVMGDFNTGFRIDAEGTMFKQSHYMRSLIDTGFVDTWRHLHPEAREYTWYSKRKDKATGLSEDLNGFRLDYIFVSPPLQHAIADVSMLHDPRRAGASDHASVVANIDLHGEDANRGVSHSEPSTETTGDDDDFGDRRVEETAVPQRHPANTTVARSGSGRVRFGLAPGSLSDMACGVNGEAFVQQLRPTYVTAEWAGGVLKEVRIWGPRVLRDGSLGRRELDHVWKTPAAVGGVRFSDLPSVVAARLRSLVAADDPAITE